MSAIIPFKVSLRFSPRSVRDQGFLNTRVMSWMISRVKISDDVDHASMMSQQIFSDGASTLSHESVRHDFSATCLKRCYRHSATQVVQRTQLKTFE